MTLAPSDIKLLIGLAVIGVGVLAANTLCPVVVQHLEQEMKANDPILSRVDFEILKRPAAAKDLETLCDGFGGLDYRPVVNILRQLEKNGQARNLALTDEEAAIACVASGKNLPSCEQIAKLAGSSYPGPEPSGSGDSATGSSDPPTILAPTDPPATIAVYVGTAYGPEGFLMANKHCEGTFDAEGVRLSDDGLGDIQWDEVGGGRKAFGPPVGYPMKLLEGM